MENNQFLKVISIIEERTQHMNQSMKRFVSECSPIYEDNAGGITVEDSKTIILYHEALNDLRDWLEMIQMADVFVNSRTWAFTELLLPCNDYVKVGVEIEIQGIEEDGRVTPNECTLYTPVGKMNYFAWKCITTIACNPVEMFYKFLSEEVDKAHMIIQKKLGKERDEILNSELMNEAGIHDVLGIQYMDSSVRNIMDFFHGARTME